MKILLMTSFSGVGFNHAPPLGLYRLKHYLKESNVDCDILDLGLEDHKDYLSAAAAGEYAIVGMSVSHYNMMQDLAIIWEFKRACSDNDCLIIAGGQEATYNYRKWIEAGVDLVFLGYSERSLAEFCGYATTGTSSALERLHDIDGVAYRDNGGIRYQPSSPMTTDEFRYLSYDRVMDLEIPFQAYWNRVRQNHDGLNFWTSVFLPETVRLYTSSNCPNRCGFCSSFRFLSFSQSAKAPVFMLNADQIFSLVKRYYDRYNARVFLFSDDEFLMDQRRVMELCDLIIDAKHAGRISCEVLFNCQARVSDFTRRNGPERTVNVELINKLAAAGFHSFGLGVETFCDRLLGAPSMNKTGFCEKDTLAVLGALLNAGMVPQVNIIIFIPEATREEITHSIRRGLHYIEKGCQVAVTPLLQAVAGAPVTENPDYPVKTTESINPGTGHPITVGGYFVPHHPDLAPAAEKIEDAFRSKLEEFRQSGVWKYERIPKTLAGILMLASAAGLIDEKGLENGCHGLLDRLIQMQEQGCRQPSGQGLPISPVAV